MPVTRPEDTPGQAGEGWGKSVGADAHQTEVHKQEVAAARQGNPSRKALLRVRGPIRENFELQMSFSDPVDHWEDQR